MKTYIKRVTIAINTIKDKISNDEYIKLYGLLMMHFAEAMLLDIKEHENNITYLKKIRSREDISMELSWCIGNMISNFEYVIGKKRGNDYESI